MGLGSSILQAVFLILLEQKKSLPCYQELDIHCSVNIEKLCSRFQPPTNCTIVVMIIVTAYLKSKKMRITKDPLNHKLPSDY